MAKRSFFEKLTGTIRLDEKAMNDDAGSEIEEKGENWLEEGGDVGQLTVDVHQTPNEIIVKAMVAGVKPEDLDISITRDMVTIKGTREETHEVADEDYFVKELYWGSFSRTILLPAEVQADEADASEKHGLLTIRLPKIDKGKQTKLRVKSNS
ncbi:MAG: Hsp20/alpha crystallin family protein [Candidatus Paceibacterota bacterium]|jgi:HSP20 family protein